MITHDTAQKTAGTYSPRASEPGGAEPRPDGRVAVGPILVATTGGADSDAALAVARLLAGHAAADVRLVSVVTPVVPSDPAGLLFTPPLLFGDELAAIRREAVAAQLARDGVANAGWPVEVAAGDPARRIAEQARAIGAGLVVIGRTGERLGSHALGGELAQRLLRLGDVPVLAVTDELRTLPKRVLVAVDFSPYAEYAARVALSVAAPDAVVHLVHVRPMLLGVSGSHPEWERRQAESVHAAFERMRAELAGMNGRLLETVSLAGDPVSSVADFARAAGTDLVVAGAHGRGFLDRVLLGSVSSGLLRRAPCSVLCVPGSALARAAQRRWASAGLETRTLATAEWGPSLAELTRRAGGRACSIEVHRPDLGAQLLAEGVEFAGADFDPHGDRLTVRVGDARLRGGYLSHSIPGVSAVDLVVDGTGDVRVLRVGAGSEQAIVSFTG